MPAPIDQLESARAAATRAWTEAMRERAEGIESAILAAAGKTPGAVALCVLLVHTRPFLDTRTQDAGRARRAAESPDVGDFLGRLHKPGWDAVLALEAALSRRHGLLDPFRDGPSGMADRLAEVLGIPTPPAPTVLSFVPEPIRSQIQAKDAAADLVRQRKRRKRPPAGRFCRRCLIEIQHGNWCDDCILISSQRPRGRGHDHNSGDDE